MNTVLMQNLLFSLLVQRKVTGLTFVLPAAYAIVCQVVSSVINQNLEKGNSYVAIIICINYIEH